MRFSDSAMLMPTMRSGAPGVRRSRQLPVAATTTPSAAAANTMRRHRSMVAGMSA